MNKRMLIILATLFAAHGAWAESPAAAASDTLPAATPATPATASDCEAKAISKTGKPLYGAAKAASIKKCVNGNTPAVAATGKGVQQSKMATCNKDAKGNPETDSRKGAERKAFMKECLAR